jgi:hypothetical protein
LFGCDGFGISDIFGAFSAFGAFVVGCVCMGCVQDFKKVLNYIS